LFNKLFYFLIISLVVVINHTFAKIIIGKREYEDGVFLIDDDEGLYRRDDDNDVTGVVQPTKTSELVSTSTPTQNLESEVSIENKKVEVEASIPEDAFDTEVELQIEPLGISESLEEQILDEFDLGEDVPIYVFDVSFVSVETNEEVEPEDGTKIGITLTNLPFIPQVVFHVTDDSELENISFSVINGNTIKFYAKEFSPYGIAGVGEYISTTISEPVITLTSEPLVTTEPIVTSETIVTTVVTFEPIVTPITTSEPVVTSELIATYEPIVTSETIVTSEPVVTPEPVITIEPVVTSEPVITPEPVITVEPVVSPIEIPTDISDVEDSDLNEIDEQPEEKDKESEDEEEDENDDKTKISKDWRCGKGIGSCKKGYCCSKYGWCGKSDLYCKVEEGCQSEFGECYSKIEGKEDNEEIKEKPSEDDNESEEESEDEENWRCGKGIGSCKKGYCCSKYGWCGKTDDYCSISKGCQSEFGECNRKSNDHKHYGHYGHYRHGKKIQNKDSSNDGWKCGKKYGSCKEGYCCSKYGWCGKSSAYCDKNKGCQSEFGKCF